MKASKVFFLLFLSILSLCAVNTQPVESQSYGIFINADGSIEPLDAPIYTADKVTYTFTGNILNYSLVVLRNNIVVNGSGYTLRGIVGSAIDLSGRSNVTIRNMRITGDGSANGIYLWNSFNNTIIENSIVNIMNGILVQNSSNNIISANNVTNCYSGISIFWSPYNRLRNNTISSTYNFAVYGTELSHFVNDIDSTNRVNGKRIYYLVGRSDVEINPTTFADLGFLALVNCQRIAVQNLELSNNGQGILLAFTANSTVTKNSIMNNSNGVGLFSSSNNFISGNIITNNQRGIQLSKFSKSNNIYANNITKNGSGIYLFESSINTVTGNNITNNQIGIGFSESSNNIIYNNKFISNVKQVSDSHMTNSSVTLSVNVWDLGYTIGGNYWSDYNGIDAKSGPNQDMPGSDGIGDTPYLIYENNKDNYPLMPYGSRPAVYIISPENKTYTVNTVPLTFTVSKPASPIGYSLDGQANVTINGNTTLTGLSNGMHSIIVYATDTDGRTGFSETIYFTIAQSSEPFPTTWIIAAIAIMAIGVAITLGLIHRRRRKLPSIKQK